MAILWGDVSDNIITEVDKKTMGKYKIAIRELLSNPGKFSDSSNIVNTTKNLKEETDSYIDATLVTLKSEQQELEDAAMKADSLSSQLSQNINMQSKQYKVPVIKPIMINRDLTREETIYFDSVDSGLISLVDKLCSSSTYIADYGVTFKKYRIGEWLFSGQKNYVIKAYLPPNEALSLQAAKEELDALFDAALSFFAEVT